MAVIGSHPNTVHLNPSHVGQLNIGGSMTEPSLTMAGGGLSRKDSSLLDEVFKSLWIQTLLVFLLQLTTRLPFPVPHLQRSLVSRVCHHNQVLLPTIGFNSSSVLLLLSVSGMCNCCLNDLGLSNQLIHRALKEVGRNLRGKTPFEPFRNLQRETSQSSSGCFCPVNAVVNTVPPSTQELEKSFQEEQEVEGVPVKVKQIEVVASVACDDGDETTTFETMFFFPFSAFGDSEIQQLGNVLQTSTIQSCFKPLLCVVRSNWNPVSGSFGRSINVSFGGPFKGRFGPTLTVLGSNWFPDIGLFGRSVRASFRSSIFRT
jgi:hypothetical protein